MQVLPEMCMMIALLAATIGFGTAHADVSRTGQAVFVVALLLLVVATAIESTRSPSG
jgi:uncharacterized membrane protein YtjA (UPF0391 family)